MKKVLIVRPGSVVPEVRARHGDFDAWFVRSSGLGRESFDVHDPTHGGGPEVDPAGYGGVLVTGSHSAAYGGEPWIGDTERLIHRAADRGVPIFGVCFGAQILATAFGGRVVPNPLGKELGTVRVELTPEGRRWPFFGGLPAVFPAQASHDDCVERLPDGACLLATNAQCRVQAFSIGTSIHAVQFHPEIRPEMMADMIRHQVRSGELEPAVGERLEGRLAPAPEALDLLGRFFSQTLEAPVVSRKRNEVRKTDCPQSPV